MGQSEVLNHEESANHPERMTFRVLIWLVLLRGRLISRDICLLNRSLLILVVTEGFRLRL